VDAVFKDVIEPLESVAVSLVATDKRSITEFGSANEIAGTLAKSVLTSSSDSIQLIKSEAEVAEGRCAPLLCCCAFPSERPLSVDAITAHG
jgi:photosystem II oxygen-evolving enhancer protein 2